MNEPGRRRFARANVPDSRRAVDAGRDDLASVGTETHGRDGPAMFQGASDSRSSCCIPDLGFSIFPIARNQLPTVRAEGDERIVSNWNLRMKCCSGGSVPNAAFRPEESAVRTDIRVGVLMAAVVIDDGWVHGVGRGIPQSDPFI